LFETNEMSERAADLACADQRNLVTRHVGRILVGRPKTAVTSVISPFRSFVQGFLSSFGPHQAAAEKPRLSWHRMYY
jgi:hypothetical protein